MSLTGMATALLLTGVAGAADAIGNRGLAAVGEVATGVGAVAGGYLWGHRRPPWRRRSAMTVLLLGWALVVLMVWWVGLSAPALTMLATAGAASAPIWVIAYGAADEAVDESARTEASTWVTTATNLGSSAGTAITGGIIATYGALTPLAIASVVAVFAATFTFTAWTKRG